MKKTSTPSQVIDDKLLKETAVSYLGAGFLILVAAVFVLPHFIDMVRIKNDNKTL